MSTDARPGKRQVDIRIATYNIHRSRGMDRRVVPSRIAEVLRDIDADAIALQEVVGAGPTAFAKYVKPSNAPASCGSCSSISAKKSDWKPSSRKTRTS